MDQDNHFAEAAALLGSSDIVIARTAKALYREMLRQYQVDEVKPGEGFNILYFFQSVATIVKVVYAGGEEAAIERSDRSVICVVKRPDNRG